MIERQTINGRPATVGYLDQGFSPTDKDAAEIVKLSYDDGETTFLSTKSPEQHAGDDESDAWAKHREGHRSPVIAPIPAAAARKGRSITPHNEAIQGFALAMRGAEKHRAELKQRFGYDDKKISLLARAVLRGKRSRPYHDLTAAIIRAKRQSS